jgi:hypothetical protein
MEIAKLAQHIANNLYLHFANCLLQFLPTLFTSPSKKKNVLHSIFEIILLVAVLILVLAVTFCLLLDDVNSCYNLHKSLLKYLIS